MMVLICVRNFQAAVRALERKGREPRWVLLTIPLLSQLLVTPVTQPDKGPSLRGQKRTDSSACPPVSTHRRGPTLTLLHTYTHINGGINVFLNLVSNSLSLISPLTFCRRPYLTCTSFLAWSCPASTHFFSMKYSEGCFSLLCAPQAPVARGVPLLAGRTCSLKARGTVTLSLGAQPFMMAPHWACFVSSLPSPATNSLSGACAPYFSFFLSRRHLRCKLSTSKARFPVTPPLHQKAGGDDKTRPRIGDDKG